MTKRPPDARGVFVREVSHGEGPTLLLLHGAGADGEVWQDVVPRLKPVGGRVLIPDLPGHGRSAALSVYGIGNMAAALAGILSQDERITIIGHSLGGAIALVLATGLFGVRVDRAFVIDVKLGWTDEEIAKGRELAAKPARIFSSEAEAIERYLKVAGLFGLIDPTSSMAKSGIVADGAGYRLRTDARVFAMDGASIPPIIPTIRIPFHLMIGTRNNMLPEADMRRFDPNGEVADGCGHNIQVERPDIVVDWITRHLRQ